MRSSSNRPFLIRALRLNCLIHRIQVEIARFTTGLFHVRMLQDILVMFQRFPISPKTSVRHGCDTRRPVSAAKNSGVLPNYCRLLPESPMRHTLRYGASHSPTGQRPRARNIRRRTAWRIRPPRIDSQPFAAVEREARVDLLVLAISATKGKPATPATGHQLAIAAGHGCADRLIRTCREPEKADESNRD